MLKTLITAAVAAMAIGSASAASAATIMVEHTFAITDGLITGKNGDRWQAQFVGNYLNPVTISEGDTFNIDVNFAQTVNLTDPLKIEVFLLKTTEGEDTTMTASGTLGFTNFTGPLKTSPITNTMACCTMAGGRFFGNYMNGSGAVSFNGLRFSGTLTDYLEPGITSVNFNRVFVRLDGLAENGGGVPFAPEVPRGDNPALVPEPMTWALMILGFGGAGSMLRRRKLQVA